MLDAFSNKLKDIVKSIRKLSIVDIEKVNELLDELTSALIEADVNIDLAIAMVNKVRENALNEKLPPAVSRLDYVIKIIHDELINLLGKKNYPFEPDQNKLNILMFVGVQGSGKTTTIAKSALYWKRRGLNPGIIGADTFRPGAYIQLKQLVESHDIEVFGEEKTKQDSEKIAQKGIKYFKEKTKVNLIFIDTSGRHKEEKGLLKEMERIAKKINSDEIILVIDATMGQNAFSQANAFNATTKIGSIIVSKMDGTARGGGALSAVAATGSKIRYIGTGEKTDDFERFDPERFVERLLGRGDISGILEKVTNAGMFDQSEDIIEAFKKGKINLRIWRSQMESFSKMGSLGKLLSMFPGMGSKLPAGFDQTSKESLKKIIAITNSMTAEELDDLHPSKKLKQSRRERVAKGSGTTTQDVQGLLKNYEMAVNAMKRLRKDRGKGKGMLGGLGGLDGGNFPGME
ncbi:MAG: Signal recognition particle 54 kDa protein [Candidatus Heimdallarchaeota archaeon LC_3]|uniref:signal-recognition-particle GTPase n=1 Tax=uncultured organism TaxID=155900 RepID=A0A0F6PYH3_9ZZZZ|nr:putative Signal recognition particle 54 kDa protein [uncultured organism]OLS21949.1 MAG: Signal recognition particle 54 kDa protein [Candidatus Heimdallarchaeota archaeon LC_3]